MRQWSVARMAWGDENRKGAVLQRTAPAAIIVISSNTIKEPLYVRE